MTIYRLLFKNVFHRAKQIWSIRIVQQVLSSIGSSSADGVVDTQSRLSEPTMKTLVGEKLATKPIKDRVRFMLFAQR